MYHCTYGKQEGIDRWNVHEEILKTWVKRKQYIALKLVWYRTYFVFLESELKLILGPC